jgi:hypothetical protein
MVNTVHFFEIAAILNMYTDKIFESKREIQ